MFIGAHVSTAGGLDKGVIRGKKIGADCIQIFVSSPRMWNVPTLSEEKIELYNIEMDKSELGPTLVHGKYLIALGSPDATLRGKSSVALHKEFTIANQIGALGLVFHPASHRGQGFESIRDQFSNIVKEILEDVDGDSLLLLETSAGSGDHIGSNFEEIANLLNDINNPRVGVCMDTQHVWAAGYDISSPRGLDSTFNTFNKTIGLNLLKAVHLNDSKKEINSRVDRHENIGDGFIGSNGLGNFLNRKEINGIPMYLEVPGIEGNGPDKENIKRVRKILE
ncbi:MAG: deoxyribonuclease IV [Dehalococcoidia bacterium]|jgi:deoxyribonuclease-4|nr:deoxyribonuclease IV [Dehalococcoidia bacterium]MDP7613274.1 deoxyribonuclease IV [Dehalococcoidia bacterium]